MNKDLPTIYIYKGKLFEDLPLKSYHVDMEEVIDGVEYITIRRKVPIVIHVLVIILLLLPIIYINYTSYQVEFVQSRSHIIRIPSEMYYDSRTKILDIDITNDLSNDEVISVSIVSSSGEEIVSFNGINPGDSIGSIPIEYVFTTLPMKATIKYRVTYAGFVFKDISKNVLIVDRQIADKDINRDF